MTIKQLSAGGPRKSWLTGPAQSTRSSRPVVRGRSGDESCPALCDPMNEAHLVLLSVEFFRQEYWSGLPIPPPGDPPHSGIELASPASGGRFFPTEPQGSWSVAKLQNLHAQQGSG